MRKKIADDIAKVEKHARFVWEIQPDGAISQEENLEGNLSVIAIIGPGNRPLNSADNRVSRALLCEIGFWRGRPYSKAFAVGATKRRKFYRLSEEQYLQVAPLVWAKLSEMAEETVSRWKKRTFSFPLDKHYCRRSLGEVKVKNVRQDFPRGVRFCFDLRDEDFVRDAHWTELYQNKQLQGQINGLVNYIDMCLSVYPRDGRSLEQFSRLKRSQPVLARLVGSEIPSHVIVETLLRLPGGVKYPHLEHLADIVGWDCLPTIAHKRANKILPKIKTRIKDLQLRINHEKNGHLVIEIYPPLPVEVIPTPVPSLSPPPDFVDDDEGSEDEITFD